MQELPSEILKLLDELEAPARLKKHLQIVYSTASEAIQLLLAEWPNLKIDKKQVTIGAALHDVGKVQYPNELVESGNMHIQAGYELLKEYNYPESIARIALVHEDWNQPESTLEELLVSLSDVIWNGIRIDQLEEKIIQAIADQTKTNFWDVYMKADAIFSKLAEGADERLLFQGA